MAPTIPPTEHPHEGAPDNTPPVRVADAADGFRPARTRTGNAVHAVYRTLTTAWCGVRVTAEEVPADTPVTCTRCAVATVEAAADIPTPDETAFLAELTGPAPVAGLCRAQSPTGRPCVLDAGHDRHVNPEETWSAPEPAPGPNPFTFTPSADEIAKAEADILARVIPGRFEAVDVAQAMIAQRAVMLADDVVYGFDPAADVRRIRALDSARREVARR